MFKILFSEEKMITTSAKPVSMRGTQRQPATEILPFCDGRMLSSQQVCDP
jgi:hypothetical protein